MRKKSHILLAQYLADQMGSVESLQMHRKAFCLGSILPDIKPSFLTTRHEFYETFEMVQTRIDDLMQNGLDAYKERVFWRKFGEVVHYIADYFTFPHNITYSGTLLEHNHYEKELKNELKAYIKGGKVYQLEEAAIHFSDLKELADYVSLRHENYLKKERNIMDDIRYILSVCFQVMQGLLQLCIQQKGSAELEMAVI